MPTIKAKKLRVRKNKDSPWHDIPAVVNGNGGSSGGTSGGGTITAYGDGDAIVITKQGG